MIEPAPVTSPRASRALLLFGCVALLPAGLFVLAASIERAGGAELYDAAVAVIERIPEPLFRLALFGGPALALLCAWRLARTHQAIAAAAVLIALVAVLLVAIPLLGG